MISKVIKQFRKTESVFDHNKPLLVTASPQYMSKLRTNLSCDLRSFVHSQDSKETTDKYK